MSKEANRLLNIISWTAFVAGGLVGLLAILSSAGFVGRLDPGFGIAGSMLLFIGYLARQLLNTNRRVETLEKRLFALSPSED